MGGKTNPSVLYAGLKAKTMSMLSPNKLEEKSSRNWQNLETIEKSLLNKSLGPCYIGSYTKSKNIQTQSSSAGCQMKPKPQDYATQRTSCLSPKDLENESTSHLSADSSLGVQVLWCGLARSSRSPKNKRSSPKRLKGPA